MYIKDDNHSTIVSICILVKQWNCGQGYADKLDAFGRVKTVFLLIMRAIDALALAQNRVCSFARKLNACTLE